jgi:hypothetical protein
MAATAAGYTDDLKVFSQAGFAGGSPKIGVIENLVTIPDAATTNTRIAVFTITKQSIVMGGYIRPVTAAGAGTASIGLVTSEDGSATTLAGEMAINGTANVAVTTAIASWVLVPAGSQVVLEISGAVTTGCECYVGLAVIDVNG